MVKNLPTNAGDSGDVGSIPASGRSPGVGNGKPLSILAWKIPWTVVPGGLQPTGSHLMLHGEVGERHWGVE